MGMRWMMGVLGMGLGLFLAIPSGWAADEGTAETAQAGGTDASREQILQTIEATRQTDPELAAEMENQLKLLESGDVDLHAPGTDKEFALGAPPNVTGDLPSPGTDQSNTRLIGPPVEDGAQDPLYNQVQSDPRMEEVRRQFESGGLSEDQAREQVFEILRDYGIEPDNGREWGHGDERLDGFERAWEQMSPEAREQMERLFGHEAEQSEMDREMFERELGSPERYFEGYEREGDYEMVKREFDAVQRDYEAAERSYEDLQREYEAPEPEYEYREYEGPPQP
jgi:hypothetical protein